METMLEQRYGDDARATLYGTTVEQWYRVSTLEQLCLDDATIAMSWHCAVGSLGPCYTTDAIIYCRYMYKFTKQSFMYTVYNRLYSLQHGLHMFCLEPCCFIVNRARFLQMHYCTISHATIWACFKCNQTTSQPVNQAICILLFLPIVSCNLVSIKIIIIIILLFVAWYLHCMCYGSNGTNEWVVTVNNWIFRLWRHCP